MAISLLRACLDAGLARERQRAPLSLTSKATSTISRLNGPSLGTMESENQHLYGVRMDSFPCAWSIQGASDMARVISRRESGIPVPRYTRERSRSDHRRAKRKEKELSFYERQASSGAVIKSVGSGYLPPHQVDTRKMPSGKAYALTRAWRT